MLSGAYKLILAVVPPCAGEYRLVRVTSVLIFPGPGCLCGPATRTAVLPAVGWHGHDLPAAHLRTRHPACRHRRAGTPRRTAVPRRNAAHRQSAGAEPHERLGRTTARTRRDFITPGHSPAPAATHAVPTAHDLQQLRSPRPRSPPTLTPYKENTARHLIATRKRNSARTQWLSARPQEYADRPVLRRFTTRGDAPGRASENLIDGALIALRTSRSAASPALGRRRTRGPGAWHGSICVEARSGGLSGAL